MTCLALAARSEARGFFAVSDMLKLWDWATAEAISAGWKEVEDVVISTGMMAGLRDLEQVVRVRKVFAERAEHTGRRARALQDTMTLFDGGKVS